MRWRLPSLALVLLALTSTWACGPTPDLKTLKLIPTVTGYYDDGPKNGRNHIVPSMTFQLKNEGALPLTNVDLTFAFWAAGDDGELDTKQIRGIANTALEVGATSEAITVRSDVGFSGEQARAEFFVNAAFRDFTIRVFAQRNGRTVKLGEVPVDRRLIPAGRSGNLP